MNFHTTNHYLVILRAFFLFSSTALQFLAFQFLPLTVTSTIEFTAPIIICLLSWPILGERVGLFRAIAIIVGFLGVVTIIRPFGTDFHPATVLSLMGAFSFAIYAILSRKLAGAVSVDLMQFYSGLIGSAIVLPMIFFIWTNPSNTFDWFILFLIGFLAGLATSYLLLHIPLPKLICSHLLVTPLSYTVQYGAFSFQIIYQTDGQFLVGD